MTCRHCQLLLSPYIDGILSPQEGQELLTHLAQCLTCTKQLQQLEENRQLIRSLPMAEVTEAMAAQLRARVQSSRLKVQQSPIHILQSAIRSWPMLSFGTVATCAASLFFYFAMMQAPPNVSAEEVVSSMDQLLSTLDPDEGEQTITEETADEAAPVWQEDFSRGFVNEDEE